MSSDLTPEQFFSGCHLQIYEHAQRGDAGRAAALMRECEISPDDPGAESLTMLALAAIRADETAIMTLVRAGADPFHVINGAGSPATFAINRHFSPPRNEAIAAFIKAGLDVNAKPGGEPYLFTFVDYAHWKGLEYALEHGGDVNASSESGESLLSYVTEGYHIPVARWLLAKGADPSRVSRFGDSPLNTLDFAISHGDPTTPEWRDLVVFRQQILNLIRDPALRTTSFTRAAEARIAEALR